MKVRWPFLLLFAVAVLAALGMRWRSHRPVAITAVARPIRDLVPAPAAGCTLGPAGPARGAAHAADGRAFHVWGPARPAAPLPIALLLHGWQSNGTAFEGWFHFEEQTGAGAYVVYPDSKGPLWDLQGESDLAYLEHVLDETARQYCVDRSRVLVFGFSYGAKMAHHLGCKRPGLVRGVVAGGGSWMDERPDCGADLPVLVLHRTSDPSEAVAWGHDAARRWARLQGCHTNETPSPLGEGCTEFAGCRAPGSVAWCEDSWLDAKWPTDWNHTVREPYRALAWRWFLALPSR